MFESLFTRPSAVARYRSVPLLTERLCYLAHCEQIGIKPETLRKIAFHQLNLVRVLDLQDGDDDLNLRKIEVLVSAMVVAEGTHITTSRASTVLQRC